MTRDRRLLYAAAFLRAAGTKYAAVVLGLFLATTRLDASVASAGLAGVAVATLAVTLLASRAAPRTVAVASAVLGAGGAVVLARAESWGVAAAGCFVGMINAMGRDRSPAFAVEAALLPSTAPDAERTRTFAWHGVAQDAGAAAGGLVAAVVPAALSAGPEPGEPALRSSLLVFAGLSLAAAVPYLLVSRALAAPPPRPAARLTPESRRVLVRVCALFGLDGLGGGFLATSLLAWFFHERFGAGTAAIGLLASAGAVLNAVSHLGAAWLAGRIGLVPTMVATHLPSSLLLASVPFAPNFGVACVLFLLREGLVEMDVPTRQSYVMAVLRPAERTFASGATLLVRLFAYVAGPVVAGPFLARPEALAVPLWIGAGTKIAYDLLLWRAFRHRPPPEERGAGPAPQ